MSPLATKLVEILKHKIIRINGQNLKTKMLINGVNAIVEGFPDLLDTAIAEALDATNQQLQPKGP